MGFMELQFLKPIFWGIYHDRNKSDDEEVWKIQRNPFLSVDFRP